jgi:branched-chain amino acid transport system permease protein
VTRRPTWLAPLALLALVALLPLVDRTLPLKWRFGSDLVPVLYFAVLGLGLNLVVGNTGLLNLGAAAFMGIGAFAFAILTCEVYPFQVGFWWGIGGALAIGGACGLVLGLPTMRLRGDYLAIVTLGFGEIVQDLLRNLDVITFGSKSINPLPAPRLPGYAFTGMGEGWMPWFYLYLAILALAVTLLRRIERSPLGRSLVAVREDELAARCMGVNVARVKLGAFAGGAALCALSGALYACSLGSSSEPATYDFNVSVLALCIVILGGMGNLNGGLLGPLIMVGFNPNVQTKLDALIKGWQGDATSNNVLMSPTNWKYLIFGLTLILMMRFRPEGLLPSRRVRRELADATDAPPAGAQA